MQTANVNFASTVVNCYRPRGADRTVEFLTNLGRFLQ